MVLKNGTLPDKMSAYSVLLQEDPVHNFASLEALVNMISGRSSTVTRSFTMVLTKRSSLIALCGLARARGLRF